MLESRTKQCFSSSGFKLFVHTFIFSCSRETRNRQTNDATIKGRLLNVKKLILFEFLLTIYTKNMYIKYIKYNIYIYIIAYTIYIYIITYDYIYIYIYIYILLQDQPKVLASCKTM